MYRLLYISILLVLAIPMDGQSTYFNNTYHTPEVVEYYGDVMIGDSTYLLGGGFYTDTSGYMMRTHDLDGNIIDTHTLNPTVPGFYYVHTREWIRTEDQLHYFICTGADIGEGNTGVIFKLNAQFDTLWTKYYDLFPGATTYFQHGLFDDGHLILTAYALIYTDDQFTRSTKICKMDMEGEVIWSETVQPHLENNIPLPYISAKMDDGYAIGGTVTYIDSEGVWYYPTVHKTNLGGEMVWEYAAEIDPEISSEVGAGVLVLSNEMVLISSSKEIVETSPLSGYYYTKAVLRQLNPATGDVLNEWDYFAEDSVIHYGAYQMIESHDGQIMMILSSPYPYQDPISSR